MANKSMTLANINVPAHLASRIGTSSALSTSLAGGLSNGPACPRISIKSSRFRIVDGDSETVLDTTFLNIVIVGANPRLSKVYYEHAWSPDAEPSAPTCFSMDGIRPDASVAEPVNDLCATCPMNAWGSATNAQGNEVKACADQKRLAIVAADDPTGPIYLLAVTPAALKNLNKYHKELSSRGIPPEVVQTKVAFDPDAHFPKLVFQFNGFLDEDTQNAVDQLFGTPPVLEVTGESVAHPGNGDDDDEVQPVTVQPPKTKAKPAPAPVVEEDAEEAADEPPAAPVRGFGAKASSAPAPKPAPKPSPKPAAKPVAKAKPAPSMFNQPAPEKPAKQAAPTVVSELADEIANLLGDMGDDD